MKKPDLGQFVGILANIGVISGIGFLAFELHQNNELLEAQARFNHKETRANFLGEFDHNPELARISVKAANSETLTPVEHVQLDAHMDRMFASFEWEFYEEQLGRLETPLVGYRRGMTNPVALKRWHDTKIQYTQAFVAFMDENVVKQAEAMLQQSPNKEPPNTTSNGISQ